jgi:hypothetical protein
MRRQCPHSYTQNTDGVNNETHHSENGLRIRYDWLQDSVTNVHRSIKKQMENIQIVDLAQYTHNNINVLQDAYTSQKTVLHPYFYDVVNVPVDKVVQSGEIGAQNKNVHFAKQEPLLVQSQLM